MKSFEWVQAQSLDDAIAQLHHGVVVKAGGVDLIDRMKEGLDEPKRVVNLHGIAGLDGIKQLGTPGELVLGPLATLAQMAASPDVRGRWPALAEACAHAATPQIRNMATIGGNLVQRPRCWYFRSADFHCKKKGGSVCYAQAGENQFHAIVGNALCAIVHPSSVATALVAYRANLTLKGKKGERVLPLEQFFAPPEKDVTRENTLGPDELIAQVTVPAPIGPTRAAYHKQVEKESFDWPMADVAVVLRMDGRTCSRASIVLGAAAPIPWRARSAEQTLEGRVVDAAAAEAAADAAMHGMTPLAQNGYKVPVFRAVIRRTILAAVGGAS
ncbi:MAG TPA: FAD binding domain-containing protein [Polyangia bacterium]|nr:FAD binding domain-containing protein [Polyangia bacterium]